MNKPHRICSWAKTVVLSDSERKVGVKESCTMIFNFSTRSWWQLKKLSYQKELHNYSKWRLAGTQQKYPDLRISFWSHRFLCKTMEFERKQQKSNCYKTGGCHWISKSCWRRSIRKRQDLITNSPIILLGKQISQGSRINSSLEIMTMSNGVVPHRLTGLSQGFWKFIENNGAKFEIIQILDLVRLQPGYPSLEFHYRNKE